MIILFLLTIIMATLYIIEEIRWNRLINYKPSEDEINKEIKIIEAEQKHRRMFVNPPPLSSWAEIKIDKNGKTKMIYGNNQLEIDRWHKEHFDWLKE